jgi:hypothetical protein
MMRPVFASNNARGTTLGMRGLALVRRVGIVAWSYLCVDV